MESEAIKNESFEEFFADKTLQLVDGLRANISFAESIADTSNTSRVHKEMKSLRRGLPISEENSIFVAVDSTENVYMKVLLAGSADTPYGHGLFEFDICLPEQYPNTPPKMIHKTGFRSGVGFSPNLYADGYVCLSLIGTWSGDDVEMWSPDKNLLQVLVSIQSLVMEDSIIAKEPGCEDFSVDGTDNIIYQNIVKVATIRHAMIEPLQNPPKGFEEVIENYFRLKKDTLMNSINKWLENAASQRISYTCRDAAFGYNSTFYNEIAREGYFKVLRETGNQLRTLLIDKFGGEVEMPELMQLSEEEVEKLKHQQMFQEINPDDWEYDEYWDDEDVQQDGLSLFKPDSENIKQPAEGNLIEKSEEFFRNLIGNSEMGINNEPSVSLFGNSEMGINNEPSVSMFGNSEMGINNEPSVSMFGNSEMGINNEPSVSMFGNSEPKTSPPPVCLFPGISNYKDISLSNVLGLGLPQLNLVAPTDIKPEEVSEDEEIEAEEETIPILLKQASSSDPQAPESIHEFSQALSHLRLNMVDLTNSSYMHGEDSMSSQATARITKELKSLGRALPCEPSGSIFIAIDSSNMSKIRALVSGNVDTPYEHGLFLLDIKLPENYPEDPPLVSLVTTGNGSVRFNPNLYNNGFVCLSIINTWEASHEEMWNPAFSTVLQVLLSIQALVMNDEVIQKEPGFEHYEKLSKPNSDYSTIVQYGNVKYAMTQMITNPPEEFKELIHIYFKLKKEDVIRNVASWVEEKREYQIENTDFLVMDHNPDTIKYFSERTVYQAFDEAFQELKEALEAL